jgi:hypothetical protein
MSDTPPAPAPVPDYNTRVKNKFQLSKLLAEADGTFSSFWPLLIAFSALLLLFLYDVSYLRYRKLVLTQQLSQVVAREKAAKGQQAFIDSLHQDLNTLAPKHPDVAAILNQYFPPAPAPASDTPSPAK